jgi:hypothetical protein
LPPVSFDVLARDFQAVWSAPTTDARLKKRIVRTLIHEAVADINDGAAEIVLTLHWVGGATLSTACRVGGAGNGPAPCRHRRGGSLAGADRSRRRHCRCVEPQRPKNRLRQPLDAGASPSLRSSYRIPVFRNPPEGEELWLNLSQAAAVVGVAPRTLRLAAERRDVKAIHPLPDGPWVFSRPDLKAPTALKLAELSSRSSKHPAEHDVAQQSLFASTT